MTWALTCGAQACVLLYFPQCPAAPECAVNSNLQLLSILASNICFFAWNLWRASNVLSI